MRPPRLDREHGFRLSPARRSRPSPPRLRGNPSAARAGSTTRRRSARRARRVREPGRMGCARSPRPDRGEARRVRTHPRDPARLLALVGGTSARAAFRRGTRGRHPRRRRAHDWRPICERSEGALPARARRGHRRNGRATVHQRSTHRCRPRRLIYDSRCSRGRGSRGPRGRAGGTSRGLADGATDARTPSGTSGSSAKRMVTRTTSTRLCAAAGRRIVWCWTRRSARTDSALLDGGSCAGGGPLSRCRGSSSTHSSRPGCRQIPGCVGMTAVPCNDCGGSTRRSRY